MESSGAFAQQGVTAPTDDPFRGDDGASEFQQGADPFEENGNGATAPPIVNREGEEIQATAEEEAELAAAQAAAEEAGVDTTGVTPEPEEERPTEASVPEAATPAAAPEPEADPTPAAGAPSEEPGAADGNKAAADPISASPSTAEADPPKAKKGLRAYRLFVPGDGPGKFEELSWFEKGGKIVPALTQGAKKQTVVLARDNEAALRHGYLAVGSPPAGAKLIAVADSQWTVRDVEPDEQQPVRQRLRIR